MNAETIDVRGREVTFEDVTKLDTHVYNPETGAFDGTRERLVTMATVTGWKQPLGHPGQGADLRKKLVKVIERRLKTEEADTAIYPHAKQYVGVYERGYDPAADSANWLPGNDRENDARPTYPVLVYSRGNWRTGVVEKVAKTGTVTVVYVSSTGRLTRLAVKTTGRLYVPA